MDCTLRAIVILNGSCNARKIDSRNKCEIKIDFVNLFSSKNSRSSIACRWSRTENNFTSYRVPLALIGQDNILFGNKIVIIEAQRHLLKKNPKLTVLLCYCITKPIAVISEVSDQKISQK